MVNLSFTIKKPNNRVVTITGQVEGNHIYRGGSIVRCSCNKKNPVAFVYDGSIVYCPCCYNTSLDVSVEDNNTDIYLNYIGVDYNTMQKLYKLSDTLPYDEWLKISEYFVKLTPSDIDLEYPLNYVGWVTSLPEQVETTLNISSEKLIRNRDVENELLERVAPQTKKPKKDEAYYFDFVDKLHEVFSVVETPYGQFDLKGEIIENPLFPPNDYGTGEYWLINDDEDEIWYVRYNHRMGDNLNFNNVFVDGELKAIGKVIGYDENVVDLLKELL